MKKMTMGVMSTVAASALLLTACGGTPTDGDGTAGTDAGGDKPTIVVDMWAGSEDDTEALNFQVDVARKANPDINIEVRSAPWGDFFTKLTTNMSSGNMACVTGMNSGMLSGYKAGFRVLSEEDFATAGLSLDDFAPGAEEILMNEGDIYGLPFDVSTMLTYYNADMIDAAGAKTPEKGWTFDDFEAVAKATTVDGKYGFGIGMGGFQWQALPIAKSGVQPVDTDGNLQMDDPAFVAAAEWYAGLVTEDKVAAPVASASDTGWGEQQFSGQNAAMAVDGTWNAVGYLKNDAGFNAGMAPLPTGDNGSLSLVLGSGYGIAADCDNPEAALKVLGSMLSQESQDYVASSGRSYPARSASQPLYFESLPEDIRDEVKETFEVAFEQTQGQRVTDNWSQIDTFIQPQLASVYNSQLDMADALKQAQDQFGN